MCINCLNISLVNSKTRREARASLKSELREVQNSGTKYIKSLIILTGSLIILYNSLNRSGELIWLTQDNKTTQKVLLTSGHLGVERKRKEEKL